MMARPGVQQTKHVSGHEAEATYIALQEGEAVASEGEGVVGGDVGRLGLGHGRTGQAGRRLGGHVEGHLQSTAPKP